jgi:hypothetical protein
VRGFDKIIPVDADNFQVRAKLSHAFKEKMSIPVSGYTASTKISLFNLTAAAPHRKNSTWTNIFVVKV